MIQHAKYLLTQTDENLCLRIMHALKSMVKTNHEFESMVEKYSHRICFFFTLLFLQGQSLRLKLLRRYFSDDQKYLKSLHQPLKGTLKLVQWFETIFDSFESPDGHSLVIVRLSFS